MPPVPPHDDLLPERRWDDEDEGGSENSSLADLATLSDEDLLLGSLRPAVGNPGGHGFASVDPATALAAGLAVGRLDARLRASPAPVRVGWEARMALAEAAASARLDDHLLDADDLLGWECGLEHGGPPSPALSAGLQILDIIRVSARRSPRSFWTPRRVVRLAGMIGARSGVRAGNLPQWLRAQRDERDSAMSALQRVLSLGNIDGWMGRPPLLVGAEIVRLWHGEGLADSAGGSVGRLLATAWVWRMGVLDGLHLPISWGFLGHAGDYAPWRADWPRQWLTGVGRAAARGSDLLSEVTRQHDRLMLACAGRRSSSRLPNLARLLIERPAVGSSEAAQLLGTTKQGVLNMLEDLQSAGLVQEISRRGSHWVWRASPA